MTRIALTFTISVIFFMSAVGLMYNNSGNSENMTTYNVKIQKDSDDIWRVRDDKGKNKGTMEVMAGDQIFWQARGSKMIFIFSKEVANYFEYDDGVFKDGKSQEIKKNKKLRVTIKEGAPAGNLTYEVYVLKDGKTVIGNSPPKLIIKR